MRPTHYKFIATGLIALFLLILLPSNVLAHGISETDRLRMLNGGYLQCVGLGATHILTGYDHLLFFFGVVFFLNNFKDVAKFVTIFTVGQLHRVQFHR